jgi:hypothetical protein
MGAGILVKCTYRKGGKNMVDFCHILELWRTTARITVIVREKNQLDKERKRLLLTLETMNQ